MQKLQDSVFSIIKTTNLSSAVFSFLQPSENSENVPLGGILSDTKHGWLALGTKFCVVDLRTGLKVAARTFGVPYSTSNCTITSVIELPTPLTENSKQLIICLECEDLTGLICILHVNGSQILRCIQTDVVITEIDVCDEVPDGPLTCFDGVIMAGSKRGEIFAFDLYRASLIQAIKDISQGYEHLVRTETNPANLVFLSLNALPQIDQHRDQAIENDDHLAIILNENSLVDSQYLFRNPDGSIRMKAKQDHIRVSSLQYIPQLGSLAVGFNFGAFQIWNMMSLELEFASQVNRECLPVTHFGFQEPCDDPRAFCYLWAVFSVMERFVEEEFPLAVMYSLTYQGKRMLSDVKCLYQDFMMATIRFQVELTVMENAGQFVGGRCVSCHSYSVSSTLGEDGEDSMLNICQLVWECWGDNINSASEYGMLLFDLDQWYKDQMPSTYSLQSNAFMSASWCGQLTAAGTRTLDVRLQPGTVTPYSHATRLEEHFYPNSIHYNCICLNTSDACVLSTAGIQRQIVSSMDATGPTALLNPPRLYHACVAAGLTPLYMDYLTNPTQEDQRRFILSVALEARLARFLKRCAHDWATGSHQGVGCTLPFLVDWCWRRAIQLKENAKELTAPLFSSSSLPDRNVVRCLEHCVQQLTQLTGLLDAILTKCCNLVVPDALSEIEEKYKGVGTVSLYFQVVQWFLRVGLLPERHQELPYPARQLNEIYTKRRMKLQRLQSGLSETSSSGSLLYIDQLIENEFGGERIQEMWLKGGSETNGLYPPPSLYSLLRLYLLPDIAEEHKHSLVLYLLVDYSMVYDVGYEAVIRRLMQFPTMFGLSNTAIKATQAFWHLDHRDFDFALDQLQCLTGNTLSPWQHRAVLSPLLAQNMTQAALQYLRVRKPPHHNHKMHHDLEDVHSCIQLYLARQLVFEALDVVRSVPGDEHQLLEHLFTGCRNTGQLSKLLQVTLLPFEEEAFISYLKKCDDPHCSDILIMYYLQQARYLEAQQYNNKLSHTKRPKDISGSMSSVADVLDRSRARDTLVHVACDALPAVAAKVAQVSASDCHEPHIFAPKPMSVFVQAKSSKNTFTYKSSFIQDTIENASETWINRPSMRRGLKRALSIEDTPFICTPKLNRTKSMISEFQPSCTPPKRAKLSPAPASRASTARERLVGRQLAALLAMPDLRTPPGDHYDRSGAGTPHSILKIRNSGLGRDAPSPVDSRYLGESDDELETASNHTHYSDSTNKHLRFTIPTASESGSTPSPPCPAHVREREPVRQKETDDSMESYVTSTSTHPMKDDNPFESPPKKLATEEKVLSRKSYKDNVRARRSLSLSANSSLSSEPDASVESIADLSVTLLNARYRPRASGTGDGTPRGREGDGTPRARRSIRAGGASTPLSNRSRSGTPERVDSPTVTPLRPPRTTRSRSRTPEISPRASPLACIPEQPRQEVDCEPRAAGTTLSAPVSRLRSRSRTPERMEKVAESPRLEVISESPAAAEPEGPRRRLRSRSRSPQVEESPKSPRTLRSRSKTPEKLMSPKADRTTKAKKTLTRIVLEANTFAKTKNTEREPGIEKVEELIECTPLKPKQIASMDVSFSPIVNTSVLTDTPETDLQSADSSKTNIQPLPAFTKISETQFGKSILQSCETSAAETSREDEKVKEESVHVQTLPALSINDSMFAKSVLHSYESSIAESSSIHEVSVSKETVTITKTEISTIACKSVLKDQSSLITNDSDSEEENWKEKEGTAQDIQKEKERIVEIQREINEIEGDMSDEESSDEEIVEADDSMAEEETSEEDEDDSMSESGDEEIISIGDSSDSSFIKLYDETSSDSKQAGPIEETVQVDVRSEDRMEQEDCGDPLNQGKVSLLTDDNSLSDNEMDLNYEDDDEEGEKAETGLAKTEQESAEKEEMVQPTEAVIKIDVVIEKVNPVEQEKEAPIATDVVNAPKSTDVVDASSVVKQPENMDVDPFTSEADVKKNEEDKTPVDNKTVDAVEQEITESQKTDKAEASIKAEKPSEKPSRLRRRASSTSSNRSKKDDKKTDESTEAEQVETRRPMTRKRAKSTNSNQSEEEVEIPIRSNPTPAMKRLLEKRAAKEVENIVEDKETPATPQRRTTRSRSKDDNASVASEDSVKSARSKGEKKGRKSIVAVKPELSAIPEMSVDESRGDVSEYSSSRRLTRRQLSVPAPGARGEPFDVQPLDRISLLNKTDFEGPLDSTEPARRSPEAEAETREPGRRPLRTTRAASETKTVPKAAKIGRRVSVDVVPASPAESPRATRAARRASFTRACAALHTPKARRNSTDISKETDSAPGSPVSDTPRRTSVSKDPNRSKKLFTVEESDAKK